MKSKTATFTINELALSVVNAISSHSAEWAETINVIYGAQSKDELYGDKARLQRALIIVIEHMLISNPKLPVTFACDLARKSPSVSTAIFRITPSQESMTPSSEAEEIPLPENGKHIVKKPKELSLSIAKKIITDCHGDMLIRSPTPPIREIFIWAPLEIGKSS